jgi:hypothetical protein
MAREAADHSVSAQIYTLVAVLRQNYRTVFPLGCKDVRIIVVVGNSSINLMQQ